MRRVLSLLCLCLMLCCGVAVQAVTMTGQVLDDNLHPVAGAQVAYASLYNDNDAPQLLTSDANGVFTVNDDQSGNWGGFYGGVVISVPGFAIAGGVMHSGKNYFILDKPVPFSLSMVDKDGIPLSNAKVLMTYGQFQPNGGGFRIPRDWWEKFTSTSDAQGRATFSWLPGYGSVQFTVSDPRVQPVTMSRSLQGENANGPMQFPPALSLHGRVLSADGAPLPHMRVSVGFYPHQTVETGEDGSYRIGGLASGDVTVSVSDPALQWLQGSKSRPAVKLKDGSTDTAVADITMQRGAVLSGTVSDSETNQPIPRQQINVYTQDGGQDRSVMTDGAGKYRLLIPPGKYQVSVNARQGGEYLRNETSPPNGSVEAGEEKTIDLTLTRGIRYTGVIQDEQGNPLSGIVLSFQPKTERRIYSYMNVTSDAQGRFTSQLTQKGEVTVQLGNNWSDPVHWQLVSPTTPITDAGKPVTLVVRPNIHGRVVSTGGEPLTGVHLECSLQRFIDPNNQGEGAQRNGGSFSTTSDGRGEFPMPVLQHGDKLTMTVAIRNGVRVANFGTLTETDGKFSMSDTVMVLCDASLSGRVLGADGKPVAGALISSPDGRPAPYATSDAQGNFTLGQLPPGEVMLVAAKEKNVAMLSARTGDNPVTINLRPVTPAAPHDVTRLVNWLQQDATLPVDQRLFNHGKVAALLVATDPDQGNALVTAEGITPTDEMRAAYLAGLLKRDPAGNANRVPTELELITTPLTRCAAALNAGMALATAAPNVAEHCAALAEGILQDEKPESVLAQTLDRLFLDAMLKHTDVEKQLKALEPIISRNNSQQVTACVFAIKSLLNKDQAVASLKDVNDYQRMSLVIGACTYVLQHAPDRVDVFLPLLQEQTKSQNFYGSDNMMLLFTLLGKYQPAAALECVKNMRNDYYRNMAMLYAVRYQPKATALASYQDALRPYKDGYDGYDINRFSLQCEIAVRAAALDPKVGGDLLKDIKGGLQRTNDQQTQEAIYGYYLGTVNQAEARAMIESCYARAKEARNSWRMVNYPWYMASVDADRALAMLKDIRQSFDNYTATRASDRLVEYLLANQEDRLMMNHNQN